MNELPGNRLSGEAAIVALLRPLSARLPGAFAFRDDCAVLACEPGMELVLKTDAVAEGVHFFADDRPEDIGWKAVAVNVSDLIAKGARPRVYLLSLALPEPPQRSWMEGLVRGLADAQSAFGISLAGGDTDRRPGPLTLTVAAIGDVPAGRMVRRGAARPGDLIYVSGTLGDAALGLDVRRSSERAASWQLPPGHAAHLVRRYLRPEPRLALAPALLAHARAAMDLSDGLMKDLGRMASASGVAARIEVSRLPLSPAARYVCDLEPSAMRRVLAGGDDYEVLAAVAPADAQVFAAAAHAMGVEVSHIGAFRDGCSVTAVDGTGAPVALHETGFDHF